MPPTLSLQIPFHFPTHIHSHPTSSIPRRHTHLLHTHTHTHIHKAMTFPSSKPIVEHMYRLSFQLSGPSPNSKINKKSMEENADWVTRQQKMLANTQGYEGQKPPGECKHTREQMVHTLPTYVSFFFPNCPAKKRDTKSQITFSVFFSSLHLPFSSLLLSSSSPMPSPLFSPPHRSSHPSIHCQHHSSTYQRGKTSP